jgi:hypothetical protein
MKKLLFVVMILSASLLVVGQNKSVKDEKVFEIKSGVVEYQVDGMSKGTKTFWFDDFGRMQCTRTVTTTKVMGFSTTDDKLEIRTREWVYNIDMKAKTGTKIKTDAAMAPTDAAYSGLTDEEKKQFVEGVHQGMNIKEAGTGEVLGRTCKIMEVGSGNKMWLYKNITLKSEVGSGMIKINETATKFDENKAVSASQFQPPAGIQIEDQTEAMKQAMEGFNIGE